MTEEEKKCTQVRQRLMKYMEVNTECTQKAVANGIVKSTTLINQFLKDKYNGNSYAVALAIDNWLNRQENKKWEVVVPTVRTSVLLAIHKASRLCQTTNGMGIVVGYSGSGKTLASKDFAKKNTGVILIETVPGDSPVAVLRKINRAANGDGVGSFSVLMEKTIATLKGTERLITIDEAENLSERSLNVIRRIHDLAEVGVIYVGLHQFGALVNRLGGEYEYIKNRLTIPVKITSITPADAQLILETIIPEVKPLVPLFYSLSLKCARRMVNLAKQCLRVLSLPENVGLELNEDLIRDVHEAMRIDGMGYADVEKEMEYA